MRCIACGYDIPENSEYCHYCGAKQAETPRLFVNDNRPITSFEVKQEKQQYSEASVIKQNREHTNNRRKKYCRMCGGVIDPANKRCNKCGKQYFRAKTVIPLVLLIMLVILLVCGNIWQYFHNQREIEYYTDRLSIEVGSYQTLLRSKQKSFESVNSENYTLKQELGECQSILDSYTNNIDNLSNEVNLYYDLGFGNDEFWSFQGVLLLKYLENDELMIHVPKGQKDNISIECHDDSIVAVEIDQIAEDDEYVALRYTAQKRGATFCLVFNTETLEYFFLLIMVI